MSNPDDLTRPERYTEHHHARVLRKRMDADRRRHGNCCICVHRATTMGVLHCRGKEDRQKGFCKWDGQQPQFQLDPNTLEKYRDAA
ncbi:hypothetical protein [Xanthomonas translucens]|uniref:hypothetical protein n=1 Tax=Xanthomonas campestris pv. translucens TaxID=343 RepID=UPI00071E8802|nr:hypothetical protein [Xanthomonas translucens]UPU47770.1 hypothetical protein MZO50_13510 [Xanthomonas translucens pv. undulosa]WLA02792.1 hypothetical protein MO330_09905 [Xanthomonas translucens]WLA06542.1 hypothetical protein MO329_09830 [Xanthomonas translucens]